MAWKKGQSGNPKGGRPKSDVRIAFEKAVKEVEQEKQKDFFKHVIECAWTDASLMKEVLKKLVPDLKHIDHKSTGGIQIILKSKNGK